MLEDPQLIIALYTRIVFRILSEDMLSVSRQGRGLTSKKVNSEVLLITVKNAARNEGTC